MKSYIFVVLTLFFAIQSRLVRAGLEDNIIDFLEELRVRMCHPIDKLGIPALDPFEIAHKEVYLDDNIFKDFSASVTNLTATGLSDFIINNIKISELTRKFTFDITFPMTLVATDYTAKGSLAYILDFVGDDNFVGYVGDVRIIITGGIKLSTHFEIKNLKIQISVNELNVEFGHLIEIERLNDFFRNIINELLLELLGDFWEDYGETYTERVENLINKIGSNFTLKDIIAIIAGSGSGEPIFGDDPPGDCKDIELSKSKNSIQPVVIQKL